MTRKRRLLLALPSALILLVATGCSSDGTDGQGSASSTEASSSSVSDSIESGSSAPAPPPGASSSAIVAPSSSARAQGCTISSLTAQTLDMKIQAFGKTRYLPIVVRNNGSAACSLPGHPTVSMLNANGTALSVPTDPQPLRSGRSATSVAPGASVSFEIAWVTVPSLPDADPAKTCITPSAIVVGFGTGDPVLARTASVTACDRGALSVYPFRQR